MKVRIWLSYDPMDQVWYVEAPDFYEGILTFGNSIEDAKRMAVDALTGLMEAWIDAGKEIPEDPVREGRTMGKRISILLFSLSILSLSLLVGGCHMHSGPHIVPAPQEVRERALYYARQYMAEGAEYQWGGQDPLPKLAVDCSGLVIRSYGYVCAEKGYFLLFQDTTSYGLRSYSQELTLEELSPGDLLFMGEGSVSHVALFVQRENGMIQFIDSTYQPDAGINGVSERRYEEGDPRFLGFGRLLIGKP
ncbi:MAG: hypothetical protein Kow009_13530 [Spirochaetales bacterium]